MPAGVSVVLPVYNGMPYLRDSLESIRAQTHHDLEIVVLDNGSTDGTGEYLVAMAAQDPRIKIHSEPAPLGMVGSSNAVVALSTREIVARMDADDVSHPDRIEVQLHALQADPNAVLVGSLSEGIDRTGKRVRPRDRSLVYKRRGSLAPIAHGSIMYRRAAFDSAGGYGAGTEGFEDQDLYRRMAREGKLLVLTDPPHRYRFHMENWTSAYLEGFDDRALVFRAAQRIWSGAPAPRLSLRTVRALGARSGAQAFVYCTWGAVSPRSMRATLSLVIRVKDAVAGWRLGRSAGAQPYEWTFD